MMNQRSLLTHLLFSYAALLSGTTLTALADDQAVVVGIQRYKLSRANTLRGCENDARSFADMLRKQGFAVTLLLNEAATRDGILAAIKKAGAGVGEKGRFVFYFAGHGRDVPRAELMPHDATGTGNGVTPDQLYSAVKTVPAAARTVVLDSCFSGAMRKAVVGDEEFRARYFAPEGAKSITARPANNQDSQVELATSSEVCYWTAAQGNEQAIEGRFKGEYHGIFTISLLQQPPQSLSQKWGLVHADVKGKVSESLGDKFHQHPTISPAYVESVVFGGKDKPASVDPAPAAPPTLWQQFHTDYAVPAMLSLHLLPNKTAFELEEPINLDIKVGVDGYLFVLDRNVDGRVYRLFPKGDVDSAAVRAGDIKRLPPAPSPHYTADAKGLEHVKAILFVSREKAQAFLAACPAEEGVTFEGMKRLREAPAPPGLFYTSEVTFSVVGKGESK